MTIRRDNVYVWVTWLSRLLVGDASCEWASWFKAHHSGYAKPSRDFNLSTWKMHHTRLLNEVRDRLEANGHTGFNRAGELVQATGQLRRPGIRTGRPGSDCARRSGHGV